MRKCTCCKKTKDDSEFNKAEYYIRKDGSPINDGFSYKCKPCAVKRTRMWQINNKDRNNAAQRKRYNAELYKDRALKSRYGLSLKDYYNKLAEQSGCCAICGVPEIECRQALFVDHNHITGQTRGLLCRKCNSILGYGNDSVEILTKARDYLVLYAQIQREREKSKK